MIVLGGDFNRKVAVEIGILLAIGGGGAEVPGNVVHE